MPFSLRSFFKKFPIFTWSTSTPPFIIKYRICYLQITRHKARNVVFSLIDTVVYAFFIFSIIQTEIWLAYFLKISCGASISFAKVCSVNSDIPLCIVDFKTLEIYSLQDYWRSYFVRDYYVEMDFDDNIVRTEVFYLPERQ